MSSEKILITGGTGYIGSHTSVLFLEEGYDVVIVDNLSNSSTEVLDGIAKITGRSPQFYQIDCTDSEAMDKVFKEHRFTGVIHFAASKAVGESVEKPLAYYHNNVLSLLVLLDCMHRYSVDTLVYSSSCTVYGQPATLPVDENAPTLKASSPYGNTKKICEEIIADTVASGIPLRAILLRYFNPIGAHPSALIGEMPLGTPQNLVPYLTQTVAGIRSELAIFGDDYDTPDGTCVRDYIYVGDLAQAHLMAYQQTRSLPIGESFLDVYNIGTGRGVSVKELVVAFEKATGLKVPHRIAARRAGDIAAIWADASKANAKLGWRATTSLEETLRTAWEWQKNCLARS